MKQSNCLQCGQEFEAKRSDKKYCSDSCKQQAYKSRSKGDTVGSIEEKTPRVNTAVFPFLKDYLRGLLSGGGGDAYPSDIQTDVEQVKVTKSGTFIVESTDKLDIETLNNTFLDTKGKIIQGRTKPINVQKVLHWEYYEAIMQSFPTYKIMIPYDLVREQFADCSDDDLILE
jgi:hypothetical protein